MDFILGAYRNVAYTRLASSLILGLPFSIWAFLTFQHMAMGWSSTPVVAALTWIVMLLSYAMYPFARELYYRMTEPIREGIAGLTVFGPLAVAVYVGKALVYILIGALSLPLGIIGFVYLAVTERVGRGLRRA